MKGLKLGAKIAVVSTSFLLGVLLCGTVIAGENVVQISSFLKQPRFKKVETEDDSAIDKEYYKSEFTNIKDLIAAGREAAELIEAEGVTLLKNDNNALPLTRDSKVSLLGYNFVAPAYGGRGSAQMGGRVEPPVTPLQGFTEAGLKVNTTVLDWYNENKDTFKPDSSFLHDASWNDHISNSKILDSIKEYNDAAFYIINRVSGEGSDIPEDRMYLSETEKSVLKGLKGLKDSGEIKKTIVLLNIANPIDLAFIDEAEYGIDACLWVGNPGINGYAAIGDIAVGKVNPSGHLSDTYFRSFEANPVSQNYGHHKYLNVDNFMLPKHNKYVNQLTYQEGIYLGYRYAETRYADLLSGRQNVGDFNYEETILRPFGYGDSYTEFEYSNFKTEKFKNNLTDETFYEITLDVKNLTDVPGKDAVQIYVQKPYTKYDIDNHIEKSAIDLVGYAKTKLLKKDEIENIKITVSERDLTSYDAYGAKTYILDDGDYYFTAGKDSHNAINNILKAKGITNGIIGEGDASLTSKHHLDFDKTTYSTTKNTKVEIKNVFDNVDPNRYPAFKNKNHVEYLSRNNWEGTFPTTHADLKMTNGLLKDILFNDNPESIEKSDVKYPTYGADNNLQLIDLMFDENGDPLPYDDEKWDQFLDQLTWDETTKLCANGFRMTADVTRLGKPETLDHNGPAGITESYNANANGLATRKNDPDKGKRAPYYPCAGILSATYNTDLADLFGKMIGEDALWAGYSGFYGIGINTHRAPNAGRTFEYFSEDPFLGGRTAAHETIELQKRGCNAYIKHFALNDQEDNRGGLGIWANEQTLREIYLKPFQIAVEDGGAMHAMAAFVRIGAEYCPGSKALLTDFLKEECGMRGLVVTDMYNSVYTIENLPNFIIAGCDIPDGTLYEARPFDRYQKGYGQVAQAMRDSAHRICYSTVHSNAMNDTSSGTIFIPITPKWQVALYAIDGVTGVLFAASIGLGIFAIIDSRREKKQK